MSPKSARPTARNKKKACQTASLGFSSFTLVFFSLHFLLPAVLACALRPSLLLPLFFKFIFTFLSTLALDILHFCHDVTDIVINVDMNRPTSRRICFFIIIYLVSFFTEKKASLIGDEPFFLHRLKGSFGPRMACTPTKR